jgi:2-dehydropantoate 2-reductase
MTRQLSIRLAGEACRVGRAHGYDLENIYKMPPEQLMAACDGDTAAMEACEDVIIVNASFRNDDQRPSMGQDMLKGRRTEIDFISGLVVEKAAELGLDVRCNAGMLEAVRKVERNDIPASVDAVAHIKP